MLKAIRSYQQSPQLMLGLLSEPHFFHHHCHVSISHEELHLLVICPTVYRGAKVRAVGKVWVLSLVSVRSSLLCLSSLLREVVVCV